MVQCHVSEIAHTDNAAQVVHTIQITIKYPTFLQVYSYTYVCVLPPTIKSLFFPKSKFKYENIQKCTFVLFCVAPKIGPQHHRKNKLWRQLKTVTWQ